jgi:hypothetical protein
LERISDSVPESTSQVLIFYLQGYLSLLESAGHHTLFCLPSFNKDGLQYIVDYSKSIQAFSEVEVVYGVLVTQINDFLLGSWRNAMLLSGTSSSRSSDGMGLTLAEFRSTWSSRNFGVNFDIYFSAPRVRALCGREVIIEFNIHTVLFFDSADLDS